MSKDRKSANAAEEAKRQLDAATKAAAEKKGAVAAAITRAGTPIVVQLGAIACAPDIDTRRAAVEVLISRIVGLANSQCGRFSDTPCNTRSALYRLDPDARTLTRVKYEGRQDAAPRPSFDAGTSSFTMEVVGLAKSERVLLVEDLDQQQHLSDGKPKYKSFISVPVRAEGRSYGLLSVDSDVAGSLTKIDLGYMILLAGSLAAGLAQLGDDPWRILAQNGSSHTPSRNEAQVPRQAAGESAATSSHPADPTN